MPFFSKDYFGKEYADISENRSAERIGERIKKIRQTISLHLLKDVLLKYGI